MKQLKYIFSILSIAILLSACNSDLAPEYQYEDNPEYTWGYQLYYGDYYGNYQVNSNVNSLVLFTDKLVTDSLGYLNGYGQYLYLYDIFTGNSDVLLPDGTYTISDSDEPFTIRPGKYFEQLDYVNGAFINYVERDENKSKIKLIIDGSLVLSRSTDGKKVSITCDFITEDKKQLKGRIENYELPAYDMSREERNQKLIGKSTSRPKLNKSNF